MFTWFGVFSRISPDILDRFSQSFHHMKALNVQMMDLYLIFKFVKERCHGNQNNVERDLCVHINSSDDQATFDINLVGF